MRPGPPTAEAALELARQAAEAAGQVLLGEWAAVRAGGAIGSKSSATDPVTRADVAAQRVIAELITARRPDDAILGEEGLDSGGQSGWQWIVDPLDGTVNYLYGRADWAVSIAARNETGRTVAAVVHAPAHGRTYAATLTAAAGWTADGSRCGTSRNWPAR